MILLPDTPGLASMMASAFTALLSLLTVFDALERQP
jgi:hypothetical protein